MLNAKKLVTRAFDYYRRDGLPGLTYVAARKLMWEPRQHYRQRKWSRVRAAAHPEPPLVHTPRGVRLYLNPQDSGISVELCAAGVHEPILTDILADYISAGSTIVDIGANIGYFALQEAKLVGLRGKVLAFEPFPVTFDFLQRNIALNHATNVHAQQLAIGEACGTASFYGFAEANWNSMVTCGREYASKIEVSVASLDEILADETSVHALRMDVEGFESHVIRGAVKTIDQHRPTVIMELHSALMEYDDVADLLKFFEERRYEIRIAFPRMREEFIARPPTARSIRAMRTPTFAELLADERLRTKQDNFSIVIAPV
ncbi:MAG: FkbM family methyltransferase [Nannocystaceae bacterium]